LSGELAFVFSLWKPLSRPWSAFHFTALPME